MSDKIVANYFKIPHGFMKLGLNPYEVFVLVYFLSLDGLGQIFPSQQTIAKVCKMSPRKVTQVINSLAKKDLIKYKKGSRGFSNRYSVLLKNIDPKCTVVNYQSPLTQKANDKVELEFTNLFKELAEEKNLVDFSS